MNLTARLADYARPILLLDAALLLVGITLTAFNMLLIGWTIYAIGHVAMLVGFLAIAAVYRQRMDAWTWVGLGVLLVGLALALPQIASIWSTYMQTPSGITMLLPADEPPIGLLAAWVTSIGLAFYGLAARGAHALPAGDGWIFLAGALILLLSGVHLIAPLWWIMAVLIVIFGLLSVGASLQRPANRRAGDHDGRRPRIRRMTDQEELQKDPQDSASGDDPITPAQAAYLETLSSQTGESVPDGMTKAAASEKIDQLRARVGGEEDRTEGDAAGNGEKHYRMLPIPPNSTR